MVGDWDSKKRGKEGDSSWEPKEGTPPPTTSSRSWGNEGQSSKSRRNDRSERNSSRAGWVDEHYYSDEDEPLNYSPPRTTYERDHSRSSLEEPCSRLIFRWHDPLQDKSVSFVLISQVLVSGNFTHLTNMCQIRMFLDDIQLEYDRISFYTDSAPASSGWFG